MRKGDVTHRDYGEGTTISVATAKKGPNIIANTLSRISWEASSTIVRVARDALLLDQLLDANVARLWAGIGYQCYS